MIDFEAMKKIYAECVNKDVWVITAKRKINRNGQIYAKRNELEVYLGTINDIRIGEYGYVDGKAYATAEANVSLRFPLEYNGRVRERYVNDGYVPLNVRCFATEEEARNELALMSTRTAHEQRLLEAKQLEASV